MRYIENNHIIQTLTAHSHNISEWFSIIHSDEKKNIAQIDI